MDELGGACVSSESARCVSFEIRRSFCSEFAACEFAGELAAALNLHDTPVLVVEPRRVKSDKSYVFTNKNFLSFLTF